MTRKEKIKDIVITTIEGIALILFFTIDWVRVFGL